MLDVLLAGVWPIVGRLSFGALVIAASLAWFFLAPAILGFKKTALWIAATTLVVMLAYSTGVVDEKNRNRAREDAVAQREEAVATRERTTIDDSIGIQPRSVRRDCKKVAYDRC